MATKTRTGAHIEHVKTNFTKQIHTLIIDESTLKLAGPNIEEPKSVKKALQSTHWTKVMQEELDALIKMRYEY